MDGATQVLRRAVELDKSERYSEAKLCYEEGIELLMKSLSSVPDESVKSQIRTKISDYMKRAEDLKSYIKENKSVGKFHETIKIKNGQIGCSYSSIFSKYINDKLTAVTIKDAYIRSHHQILNLLRFAELLVKKAKCLKSVNVVTGKDLKNPTEQQEKLRELISSLKAYGVCLELEYSDTLHDREIVFDNGWIIKIGRGLDYFKSPKGRTSLGFCDLDLRECHETSIDVYQTNHLL